MLFRNRKLAAAGADNIRIRVQAYDIHQVVHSDRYFCTTENIDILSALPTFLYLSTKNEKRF